MYKNPPSILLIGCGPHAERVYIPALVELDKLGRSHLTCVLEVSDKILQTKEKLITVGLSSDVLEVERTPNGILTEELKVFLDEICGRYVFDGVIIATEPTQHKQYILWALQHNLHILVDKPITTYDNVSNDITLAQEINNDFRLFLENYTDRSKAFSINTQRRYHKGFLFVQKKIREIADRFQMPVTSISAMHSDGQWLFPDEIAKQSYHSYNSGYGKVSHSGYHILDMVAQYIKAGRVVDKEADEYEYFTKFIRPDGVLKQIPIGDYNKIFHNHTQEIDVKMRDVNISAFPKYGEVDSHTSITAKRHGINIAHYSINLMHNTFSRRDWVQPGRDLYKGNGRVKHEYHNIVQGPFQTIQIHSYQSKDKHEKNDVYDYGFGGNNHFDICVFRNNALTGDKKPFEQISIKDIDIYDESKLVTEITKKTVVYEFLDIIHGDKKPEESYSHFLTHAESAQMMSAVYVSAHQSGVILSSYKYES